MSIINLSALNVRRNLVSNVFTVTDYVNELLRIVVENDGAFKAWEYLDPYLVLCQANKLDYLRETREKTLGPLYGIPVGIKDIFNTIDMPTQMGSPVFKNYNPGNDARVVSNLRDSDALIMGKTVTAELAVHSLNKTRNPHNILHSPGTSSSGSAVAVSSGMVPLAIGTQSAGSIIRPSSYCGIYGFKPSYGTIPRTGVLKTADTLDQVGFFARHIEDLVAIFDAARVKGGNYPLIQGHLDNRCVPVDSTRRWYIGVIDNGVEVLRSTRDYVRLGLDEYAQSLFNFGCVVDSFSPPCTINEIHELHDEIYCAQLAYNFREEIEVSDDFSDDFKRLVVRGKRVLPDRYRSLIYRQAQIAAEMQESLKKFDLILVPSTAQSAPHLGGADIQDTCLIWTFCGFPVVNIPVFRPGLLPFGLQLVAPKYHDLDLLQFLSLLAENDLAPPAPIASQMCVRSPHP